MKKIIWSHLMMAIATVLSMTVTSCKWPWEPNPDHDDDIDLPECYVNKENLSFDSKKGDVMELGIFCSGKWEISGIPDWLIAESTEGRGSTIVKFTTSVSNGKSTSNEGYMRVTFSENPKATETVYLEQRGGAIVGCKVTPNLIVTLSNGIALDFNFDNDVVRYYRGYIKASSAGRMSDEEIIETLKNDFYPHVPSDEEVADFDGLSAGTRYIVYTLGFDKNGERGELLATEVSTMNTKNNEPVAEVYNLRRNGNYWNWSTRKSSASCNDYYMMTSEKYNVANASDVCQAWWMEYALQSGTISEYANDADWKQKVDNGSLFFVWTRGVDTRGNMSGKIDWEYITATTTRSASETTPICPKQKSNSGCDHSARKLSSNDYRLYRVM